MTPLTKAVDNIFWYLFLAFIAAVSFITQPYHSQQWLWFTACFYLFTSCYCLNVAWHGCFNRKAINAAFPLLIFVVLGGVWLFIQTRCVFEPSSVLTESTGLIKPDWLQQSCTFSMTPKATFWLMFENIFILVWLLVSLSIISTRNRLKQLVVFILIIVFLHAIIGLIAKFTGTFLVDKNVVDGHFDVVRGWFVNRNHFAAFMNIGLFSYLIILIKGVYKEKINYGLVPLIDFILSPKLIMLFGAAIILVASMLSQSRAALLSFYVACALIVCLLLVFDRQRLPVTKLVMLMSSTLIVIFLVYGGEFVNRLSQDSLNLGERTQQWQLTVELIRQKVFLGFGGGSYSSVFQSARDHQEFRNVVFNQAHNSYLHIWLEQGLLGLCLWLGGLVFTFYKIIRHYISTNSTLVKSVMLGSLGVLLVSLMQAMVDFNLHIMNIKCYVFIFIATVFSAPYVKHK